MSALLEGAGILRRVIEAAAPISAQNGHLNLDSLTVLQRGIDPYRFDRQAAHICGKWFAEQVSRFLRLGKTIHLRGLFYLIVARGAVRKPDGKVFVNTDKNWEWLAENAAKAARWLGYVPFERIVDERNAPPELFVPEPSASELRWSLTDGDPADVPDIEDALPSYWIHGFDAAQPYRIIFIGEKVSLATELRDVAREVGGELVLPTGEISDTLVAGIAKRAAEDGRPAVVFYFSDFDPSGHQMPVSVSRKLQALCHLYHHDLKIEVHHVGLRLEQVRHLDLPSTPLKATESRANHWREVMGHEQTEIDALLALHPGEVRRLAMTAVAPFWDATLTRRVQAAREDYREIAEERLLDHPEYAAARAEIEYALQEAEQSTEALHAAQERAREALSDVELPELEVPQAELGGHAPTPLFTTDDDFAEASLKLIAHKALDGEGRS